MLSRSRVSLLSYLAMKRQKAKIAFRPPAISDEVPARDREIIDAARFYAEIWRCGNSYNYTMAR